MRRCIWSIVTILCIYSTAFAQDQTNFTQFYINPYLYNPSYVGIDGQTALSIIYRKQWMTVEGAPTIANVTLQTPIAPRAGFGLSISNDSRGPLNNSAILFTFGYNVALTDDTFLRFGISGGGSWNTLDMTKLESMSNDPALINILENNASVTGNAGISLHLKTFQFGASMPTLFTPSYLSDSEFSITEIKPFQSIILNASNRFYFGDDKHIFEPYLLYRVNADLPPQLEAAGIFHLNHLIWFGGSYKQDFGISALAGLKVKNALSIGASYSLQNSGVNELNSPSFEISLNMLFGKRKKNAPVHSFVNTVKEKRKKPVRKSSSEQIAEKRKADEEARKKQQAELAKKKQEEDEAKALAQKEREAEAERVRQAEVQRAQQQEAERVKQEESERARLAEEARKAELAKNTQPVIDGRHETFRRGDHTKELAKGDYIIAGVFSSEANAKRYTGGLVQLSYKADYGYLTEKQLWYVYIYRSDDIDQARVERDKYRKLRMFKDAWLLTIVE